MIKVDDNLIKELQEICDECRIDKNSLTWKEVYLRKKAYEELKKGEEDDK